MKTNDQRVAQFLLQGGVLTPMIAWQQLGVYRLSGVIHRLRNGKGHSVTKAMPIETKTVPVVNRFGKTVHVAGYQFDWGQP